MDNAAFDALSRSMAAAGTRRGLMRLLITLPLLGPLTTVLADDTEAAGRRKRRKKRHHHLKGDGKDHRKGRRKGDKKGTHTCRPEPTAVTCAGKCGGVTNTCGDTVDCGSCVCSPACPICQICNAGTRVCEPLADGARCGDGQRCVSGTCVCDATSCPTGCCDGSGACRIDAHSACGTGGGACTNCQASNSLCEAGTCQPCDVCLPGRGCPFTSVNAAIAATPTLSTVRVCPGTYVESLGVGFPPRPLSVIGAGDGPDDATNTILKPTPPEVPVVSIGENPGAALRGLRLTGAEGLNGFGLHVFASTVSVTDCTITGNGPTGQPGGMLVIGRADLTMVTLTNTHITDNTGGLAGGINVSRGNLTLDPLSRVTGNTATNTTSGFGGIRNFGGVVDLPSVDNVTGNTSPPGRTNCGGGGAFNGPGGEFCLTH